MKVKEGRGRYSRKDGREIRQNKTTRFKLPQAYTAFEGHKCTSAQVSIYQQSVICYNKSD